MTTAPNQFEIAGPVFKPATQYLTSQGYPLGTTCWFFEVKINFCCEIICGDTIDSAWAAVVAHLHAEGGLPNVNVRVTAMAWDKLAIHEAIEATHPCHMETSESYAADALAMELIHKRHDKREIVNLIRWCLMGCPTNC